MDLQQQYEGLFQEALALKAKGHLSEADAKEAKAAHLLQELKARIELHPDDVETAAALLFLAERDWAILGDHLNVQSQIERALAIRIATLGPDDAAVAEAQGALAEFHFLAGRFGQAEPHYRRAIAIFERHAGANEKIHAKCQGGMAQTLAFLGRSEEADAYFAKAIDLMRQDGGDKQALYFLMIYRAEGLEKRGFLAEAEALRQDARALLPKTNPGEAGYRV